MFKQNWILWVEAGVFALIAVILCNLVGLLFPFNSILMLIPLQILMLKRGKEAFIFALITAFILIAVFQLAPYWQLLTGIRRAADKVQQLPLALITLFFTGLLFMGLAVLNLPIGDNIGSVAKLLLATSISIVSAFICYLYISSKPEVIRNISGFLDQVILFKTNDNAVKIYQDLWRNLKAADKTWFLLQSANGLSYMIYLAAGWWIGSFICKRFLKMPVVLPRVINFHADNRLVGGLLGSVGLILLSLVIKNVFLGIIALNCFIIIMIIYGIQGLGIIRFLIEKHKIPVVMKKMIPLFIFIIGITIPQVLWLLTIIIPGLGVSEIWIKHRKIEKQGEV